EQTCSCLHISMVNTMSGLTSTLGIWLLNFLSLSQALMTHVNFANHYYICGRRLYDIFDVYTYILQITVRHNLICLTIGIYKHLVRNICYHTCIILFYIIALPREQSKIYRVFKDVGTYWLSHTQGKP
ncbi:hypothetical protein ACJX0J_009254, partial [Zea mays]